MHSIFTQYYSIYIIYIFILPYSFDVYNPYMITKESQDREENVTLLLKGHI